MAAHATARLAALLLVATVSTAFAQEVDIYPPYRSPTPPDRRPAVSAWLQFLPLWRLRGELLRSCGAPRVVKVTLDLTFAPNGSLTRSGVVTAEPATQACVAERVRSWRLLSDPDSPPRLVRALVRLSRTRVEVEPAP